MTLDSIPPISDNSELDSYNYYKKSENDNLAHL